MKSACAVAMGVLALASPAVGAFAGAAKGVTAKRVEDVGFPPKDAEPFWPYESQMQLFMYGKLQNETQVGVNKCSSTYPGGQSYYISDGVQDRCFEVVIPENKPANEAWPILYFSHGSGGSAYKCGEASDLQGRMWIDVAIDNKFILVCGESVQSTGVNEYTGEILTGGKWSMPEIFTEASGANCDLSVNQPGGIELAYYREMLVKLETMPEKFDLTRIYMTGCSQGSAMTIWLGVCNHKNLPDKYPAIATHSTGLKVKGDGNILPPIPYDTQYTWGECPSCKYWPTLISSVTDGLKACIFDNTEDARSSNPAFYRTSRALGAAWNAAGYRSEENYHSGGHCVMHSFDDIGLCLDDGTGHLMREASQCTDTAPDTDFTCYDQFELGKCDKSWMVGYCCHTCFDCATGCGA